MPGGRPPRGGASSLGYSAPMKHVEALLVLLLHLLLLLLGTPVLDFQKWRELDTALEQFNLLGMRGGART